MSKQPAGNAWNRNRNFLTTPEDAKASHGGFGMPLAANGLCSVDFDNVELAESGLRACGFEPDWLRGQGVVTTSTRPGSGGRVTFRVPDGLNVRWLKFANREAGVILELRACADNLQDCLPGTIYRSKDGRGPWRQDYAGPWTFDTAPSLPPNLAEWWVRMSTDLEFFHSQQKIVAGPKAQTAVSGYGGALAFKSPHRRAFNGTHAVTDILVGAGYVDHGRGRFSPPTASGAPGVRALSGKDDLWRSDHASDPLWGTFDAWCAFVVLVHDYDVAAAERAFQTEGLEEVPGVGDVVTKSHTDRREQQRAENGAMQDEPITPLQPIMSVDEMVRDFVFIETGSIVGRKSSPKAVLKLADMRNSMSASKTPIQAGDRVKYVDSLNQWLAHLHRATVHTRTFAPGAGVVCCDPEGNTALNTWRPATRGPVPPGVDVSPFLDHVEYLFPDPTARGTFLDFIAHIEQKPGELPHYGWLHIATSTGTGRNWMSGLFARLFRGYVAPNLDLGALLKSQFNGVLAGRLLAVVDEVREGGGSDHYKTAQAWKRIVNPEYRTVNAKNVPEYHEHNACRWLVFSNHEDAMPLDDSDRRTYVVLHDSAPMPAAYYERLYPLLNNPEFVNAVGVWLSNRDISMFKPGARPPINAAKRRAIEASKPMVVADAERLVTTWPRDVICNADVAAELSGHTLRAPTPGMVKAMRDAGSVQRSPVKIHGTTTKLWVLRNVDRWAHASGAEVIDHIGGGGGGAAIF